MTSHYREYKVKAAAKADRAKAAAIAAKLAAAEKRAVTSKHPLSTFWGENKSKKRGRPAKNAHAGRKQSKQRPKKNKHIVLK